MERKGDTLIKVAVSIVSFNTKTYLQKCLQDLSDQKTTSELEIWVLDNNSQDGSQDLIAQNFPKVNLIKSDKNLGFAKGQNKILTKAQADFYLVVNPDTKIPSDAISKMVDFFKENPDCGILGTKLIGFNRKLNSNGGDLPFSFALLSWLFNLESMGFKYNFHRNDTQYYMTPKEVGWVGGTFMMVKGQVFEKIGFFDPDYFMYVEDVDFCYRARLAGFKIMIDPEVEISHKSGASSQNPKFYQWKSEFQNLILFYKKNLGTLPAFFLKILICASLFLRILAFAVLGKGKESQTYAKILVSI